MSSDHYAIVIGLNNYQGFKDPPANLRGAENDADAVYEWLVNEGGLCSANIKLIKSGPANRPTREEMEKALMWIDDLAQEKVRSGDGPRVGARIYMHMSGHGYSPDLQKGCLLAADAGPRTVNANIEATAWLQFLRDSGYFSEYILLMDCCMDRAVAVRPAPAPLLSNYTDSAPGPAFVAFAAQRPLKAVEGNANGTYHGVFTRAFIDGMRGAAASDDGVITSESMARWLRHSILSRLTDDDRRNDQVSKGPEIVALDPFVLATDVQPLLFQAQMQFSQDAVGKKGLLWSGLPPKSTKFEVSSAPIVKRLKPGLYVVEVPDAGYRQGFEVVQDLQLDVNVKGAPIVPPKKMLELRAAADVADYVSIVGADFETVGGGPGSHRRLYRFGIYKVQVRAEGNILATNIFALDKDQSIGPVRAHGRLTSSEVAIEIRSAIPFEIRSPVPFENARTSDKYHRVAAQRSTQTSECDLQPGGGAKLMLMARSWSDGVSEEPAQQPWKGILLVDEKNNVLCNLEEDGERVPASTEPDQPRAPYAVCSISLDPGSYFLRYEGNDGLPLEQSLILPVNWQLEAFLLTKKSGGFACAPDISFLMRKPESGFHDKDRLVERMRIALADGRPILSKPLLKDLVADFRDPMEGILVGHHLLLEKSFDDIAGNFDTVVRKLRKMVGREHPDVEALSTRCSNKTLRRLTPVNAAPMFENSWRLLVEASQIAPEIVPVDLWERVTALSAAPPYLVWSTDQELRRAYREGLEKFVHSLGSTARDTKRRRHLTEQFIAYQLPASAIGALGSGAA